MNDSNITDESTVEEHLKAIVGAAKERGKGPAGDVTARVGTHPKVTTVWEPDPPVDSTEMYVYAETESDYHKVEFGRHRGEVVAAYHGSRSKDSDAGKRTRRTLARSYHRQPPVVAAVAGGES
jgi:hypothetical protein